MRKIQVKIPIFKEVQVDVEEKDIWVTSDGVEYPDEQAALIHEKIKVEMKERLPIFPEVEAILDCKSPLEIMFYKEQCLYNYNDDEVKFDLEKLSFPGTFVLYRVEENSGVDYKTTLHCVNIHGYKKLMKDILEKL